MNIQFQDLVWAFNGIMGLIIVTSETLEYHRDWKHRLPWLIFSIAIVCLSAIYWLGRFGLI